MTIDASITARTCFSTARDYVRYARQYIGDARGLHPSQRDRRAMYCASAIDCLAEAMEWRAAAKDGRP